VPLIVFGIGIILLIASTRTKVKMDRIAMKIIGLLLVISSVIFIGGCVMITKSLQSLN
jgi:hypothetical protein